jgi:ParB-like chromosome segregation protein Spo0J
VYFLHQAQLQVGTGQLMVMVQPQGQVYYFKEQYQELEQEIMKNGVMRPVIIGDKRNMMIPESGPKWPNRTLAHPLLDGHHRAFFAIKHGLEIPVSLLKKHY